MVLDFKDEIWKVCSKYHRKAQEEREQEEEAHSLDCLLHSSSTSVQSHLACWLYLGCVVDQTSPGPLCGLGFPWGFTVSVSHVPTVLYGQ